MVYLRQLKMCFVRKQDGVVRQRNSFVLLEKGFRVCVCVCTCSAAELNIRKNKIRSVCAVSVLFYTVKIRNLTLSFLIIYN